MIRPDKALSLALAVAVAAASLPASAVGPKPIPQTTDDRLGAVTSDRRVEETRAYRLKHLLGSELGVDLSFVPAFKRVEPRPLPEKATAEDRAEARKDRPPVKIVLVAESCANRSRTVYDRKPLVGLPNGPTVMVPRLEAYEECAPLFTSEKLSPIPAAVPPGAPMKDVAAVAPKPLEAVHAFIPFAALRKTLPDASFVRIKMKMRQSWAFSFRTDDQIKRSITEFVEDHSETLASEEHTLEHAGSGSKIKFRTRLSLPPNPSAGVESRYPDAILSLVKKFPAGNAKVPEIRPSLEGDTGVSENYTNVQHIWRVFQIFQEQKNCVDWSALKAELAAVGIVDADRFMTLLLVFHDIGKPAAVRDHKKHLQHQYTIPLMETYFHELGYSKEAVEFAVSVVDHEVFGNALRRIDTPQKAADELVELWKKQTLGFEPFLKIQEMFYAADAGAYQGLYADVFKRTPERCIVPAKPTGAAAPAPQFARNALYTQTIEAARSESVKSR